MGQDSRAALLTDAAKHTSERSSTELYLHTSSRFGRDLFTLYLLIGGCNSPWRPHIDNVNNLNAHGTANVAE